LSSCPRRLKNGLDNHFSVKCFPRKITQDNTGEIEVLIITVKTNRITKLRYKKIFKSGVFTHWWLPQTAMFLNPDLHKILWFAGNYSFLRHCEALCTLRGKKILLINWSCQREAFQLWQKITILTHKVIIGCTQKAYLLKTVDFILFALLCVIYVK